jgi:uncharacterized membrane protein YsdA (DUF1294 family)
VLQKKLHNHKRLRNMLLSLVWLVAAAGWWLWHSTYPLLVGWLLLNAYAALLMRRDKQAAKTGMMRIPEASLLLVAACGGAPGMLAGMFAHRHKTRHLRFLLIVPLFCLLQLFLFLHLSGCFYFFHFGHTIPQTGFGGECVESVLASLAKAESKARTDRPSAA